MSDEKQGKPSKSVMGNLPSTRPTRMARRRDGEPASNGTAAPAKPAAARTSAERKPAPAKSRSKPVAGRKAPAAKAPPRTESPRPRAVRSGSPSLGAAKKAGEPRRREPAPAPPKGTELVTTTVRATGELAKIGLTLGGQALKRAVDRLPKP